MYIKCTNKYVNMSEKRRRRRGFSEEELTPILNCVITPSFIASEITEEIITGKRVKYTDFLLYFLTILGAAAGCVIAVKAQLAQGKMSFVGLCMRVVYYVGFSFFSWFNLGDSIGSKISFVFPHASGLILTVLQMIPLWGQGDW